MLTANEICISYLWEYLINAHREQVGVCNCEMSSLLKPTFSILFQHLSFFPLLFLLSLLFSLLPKKPIFFSGVSVFIVLHQT